MGWGGSALAMIQSIRNNRELLKKRNNYFHAKKSYLKAVSGLNLTYPKATKEQLREIREKIRKQKRRDKLVSAIVIVAISPFIIWGCISFYNNLIDSHDTAKKNATEEKVEKYQFHINDGDKMIEQGKWKNAIFQYTRASEIFPNEFDAQYRIALAYSYMCQYENEGCERGDSLTDRLYGFYPDDPRIHKLIMVFSAEKK